MDRLSELKAERMGGSSDDDRSAKRKSPKKR